MSNYKLPTDVKLEQLPVKFRDFHKSIPPELLVLIYSYSGLMEITLWSKSRTSQPQAYLKFGGKTILGKESFKDRKSAIDNIRTGLGGFTESLNYIFKADPEIIQKGKIVNLEVRQLDTERIKEICETLKRSSWAGEDIVQSTVLEESDAAMV